MTDRLIHPPGTSGPAPYTPGEMKLIREHVTGAVGWTAFKQSGAVTESLRQAYREAVQMHEMKAQLGAKLLADDEPDIDPDE